MMNSTPAISILTPVWNGLPYIKETIASVLSQDFQDWELLISDNASTDGTSEYLRTLTDPRIHVVIHEKNRGVYKNIRFLFSNAKAPISVGLCADDYLYPGGLRTVLQEWEKASPDVAYIAFNWKNRMNQSRLARYSYEALPKTLNPSNSRLAFFLFGNIPGNLSEVSMRVGVIKAADDFVEYMRYAGDFEFWSRVAKTNSVILSDANTVFIRRHDRVASTYMLKNGAAFTERLEVYEKLIEELSPNYDRWKLVAFYNIGIRSAQLRDALVAISKGHFVNFKIFINGSSPIFWPKWIQLIVCFPFALSEDLRLRMSVVMARKIMHQRRKE